MWPPSSHNARARLVMLRTGDAFGPRVSRTAIGLASSGSARRAYCMTRPMPPLFSSGGPTTATRNVVGGCSLGFGTRLVSDVAASSDGPPVRREKLRDLHFPVEVLPQPFVADCTHPRTQYGIVEQSDYLVREVGRVVALSIQTRLPSGHPSFAEIELHDRLAQRHVLHDLVHRRDVIHAVRLVRVHAYVRRSQHGTEVLVRQATREVDVLSKAKVCHPLAESFQLRASTYGDELNVRPSQLVHYPVRSVDKVVKAVLDPHDPDVGDEERTATLPPRVRSRGCETCHLRCRSDDEDVVRRHVAARQSDTLIARIGLYRHVSCAVS